MLHRRRAHPYRHLPRPRPRATGRRRPCAARALRIATGTAPGMAMGMAAGSAQGFTLIEMLVVLAVMALGLSVAMPAMSEFSSNNQVAAVRSGFSQALALARTEAAKRGVPVLVQAMSDGPSGNEFAQGWEIVVDADANGQAGSSEPRVRRQAALPSGVHLSGASPLVFRASGALASSSDQQFSVCRASGSHQGYAITVTPSGGADVAKTTSCP